MLDLQGFKDTARRMTVEQAAAEMGTHADFWDDTGTVAVWMYAGLSYLEELEDGSFHCLIFRDEFEHAERAPVEAFLYFENFVSEIVEDWTRDRLTILLREWCEWSGIDRTVADAFIAAPHSERITMGMKDQHAAWLVWFDRTWDDADEE